MKRLLLLLSIVFVCTACKSNSDLDRALEFREQMLNSNGCSFDATVVADYGDKYYTFLMFCKVDQQGNLAFTVKEPQTISDISGNVYADKGELVFDDRVLMFHTLADGYITPVSAPWVVVNSLRSGYLRACGRDGEYLVLSIDDSYEAESMNLQIRLDSQLRPVNGELIWKGKRILSVNVDNFTFL